MSLSLMGGKGRVPYQRVLGLMLVSWLWHKHWG